MTSFVLLQALLIVPCEFYLATAPHGSQGPFVPVGQVLLSSHRSRAPSQDKLLFKLINPLFFFLVLNVIFLNNTISGHTAAHVPDEIQNPSVSFAAFPGKLKAAAAAAEF